MNLDPHIPPGPWPRSGRAQLRHEAGQPGQQAQVSTSSSSAPAWPAPRRRPRWPSWATTSRRFCFQDSPRRAHSIAAQGGINAAKNYQNDGDSVYRLFYDTIKGGDFRSREANVYRLAQVSVNIIDQCVAQGVPFAREYGGLLANRSFGGAQVSRTFYCRGQTGQQLLLGAYQALCRQIGAGQGEDASAHRDARPGRRRRPGPRHRRPRPGHRQDRVARRRRRRAGDRRLRQRLLPLHQRHGLQRHRDLARLQAAAPAFANPCYTQIHPTCIPVTGDHQSKLTLMSRVAAQRRPRLGAQEQPATSGAAGPDSRRRSATTTWSANIRASATWRRATSPRGRPRRSATRAAASAPGGRGVYLDFADAIKRLGED